MKGSCCFFSRPKLQLSGNPILRTLTYLPTVKYEIMGLAAKYGLWIEWGALRFVSYKSLFVF